MKRLSATGQLLLHLRDEPSQDWLLHIHHCYIRETNRPKANCYTYITATFERRTMKRLTAPGPPLLHLRDEPSQDWLLHIHHCGI